MRKGEEVNIDYGFDFYATTYEERQKRARGQYFFSCTCIACQQKWPVYNDLLGRPRKLKAAVTASMAEDFERAAANYQIGMDFLLRLDIATALPIFKDYLTVMNELVEHPDCRYIDCEEAYKQCLWLENRGYKAKMVTTPTAMSFEASSSAAASRQISQSSQ